MRIQCFKLLGGVGFQWFSSTLLFAALNVRTLPTSLLPIGHSVLRRRDDSGSNSTCFDCASASIKNQGCLLWPSDLVVFIVVQ